MLNVTAAVPLIMPVAATEVAVLNVMEPAPTLVIVVPAGMPVPETGMPTRKPVVFASGMTVPAAVCAAWAEGAAKTAAIRDALTHGTNATASRAPLRPHVDAHADLRLAGTAATAWRVYTCRWWFQCARGSQ